MTHLLGAGHLTRAAALARAFARAGHETTLVSGGMPSSLVSTEGVRFVQLPPVRTAGVDFRTLLDEAGEPVAPERMRARRAALLASFAETRPDAVITELFPFGRRVLADEFMALVEAASPSRLLVASVRDVLVAPAKLERVAETHRRLAECYDGVLVHGDPTLVPLDASWPVDDGLRPLLRYTGYVDEGAAVEPGADAEQVGIVVSGGSSAAALPLLRAAIGAAARLSDHRWRLLVGGGVKEADFGRLRAEAPTNAAVERARPDFRALLARASVSVSQAGYNTAVDLLRAVPRALLVPFEAGRETEQRLRAKALATRGLAAVLPEAELSAATLARAVAQLLAAPPPEPATIRLDGAAETVAAVDGMLDHRGGRNDRLGSPLDEALRRAEDAGVTLDLWWRDDDAVAATPALERLLGLGRRYRVPLALAAIPGSIHPSLPARLADTTRVAVLAHGWLHADHAPRGERKAEFGSHRTPETMTAELAAGLQEITAVFAARALPILVPPWNRIAPSLIPALPALGYAGLSTFGPRGARSPAPGLLQVNTHLDPIDWRGQRGLADEARLEADLARAIGARIAGATKEPIGLLTHHLIHDEAIWAFCERLLERLGRSPVLRYPFVGELFSRGSLPRVIEP